MARSKHGVASAGIAYSVGTSTSRNILAARDAQGVCAILIGSGPEELTSDLAKRFPQSELVRDDRELDDDLQKVLRFVETPSSGLTLELAMRGTPFQQRVWEALIKVPPGRIITYAALAARIGQPTAVRAVAMPARRTLSRSRSHAIVSLEVTAHFRATAGASSVNARCWRRRRSRERA